MFNINFAKLWLCRVFLSLLLRKHLLIRYTTSYGCGGQPLPTTAGRKSCDFLSRATPIIGYNSSKGIHNIHPFYTFLLGDWRAAQDLLAGRMRHADRMVAHPCLTGYLSVV